MVCPIFLLLQQRSKRNIIGFFEKKDSDNYHTYEKVANILRDDCTFLAAIGWASHLLIHAQKLNQMKDTCCGCFTFGFSVALLFLWNLICFIFNSPVSESERVSGDNLIFKPLGEGVPDMIYLGSLTNFDLAYAWAQDKCVPLVREITFENGEVCYLIESIDGVIIYCF